MEATRWRIVLFNWSVVSDVIFLFTAIYMDINRSENPYETLVALLGFS